MNKPKPIEMYGDSVNIPEINTVIDVPLSEVKSAMAKVCEKCNSVDSGVRFKTADDIFGVYDFFVNISNSWNGFTMGNMKITLNDEAGKTRVKVNTINTGGNYQAINTKALVDAQQAMITSLSNAIRGIEPTQVSKGAGCLGIVILFIAVSAMLIIL